MVALRLFSLLLALGFAVPAYALTFPYEAVTQGGRNNIIDSNGESCDNSTFNGAVWTGPGQGCYNRTGGLCSAQQNQICDLQIVPKGRCTYGNLSATGGPGGTNTCVWPHGAGSCTGNPEVGCLSDDYIRSNGAFVGSGPSQMCTGTGNPTCNMTTDPYGGPFRTACQCQGENAGPLGGPVPADFETNVCGVGAGNIKAVCSDGDPDRDEGGYGTALGVELNLGGAPTFANMGPSITGSSQPTSSPPYGIENIAANEQIEPQRGAGTVNRPGSPITAIHPARTTDARDIDPNFNAALQVSKIVAFGDSYYGDWAFASQPVTGTFNTHIVVFSCDPPENYATDQKIDPTPGSPGSGDEAYCHQLGRDGIQFQWGRDLTPGELAANPTCPPNCMKDFDVTTSEINAFIAAGLLDPDAGAQLAIQSGEGRQAGAGDAIGVAVVTSNTWLNTNDMRCRIGGWGNPGGEVGRCSDSATVCPTPGVQGPCAAGQQCRACLGPYNAISNPAGLPIGYNTHGLNAELGLVEGQRIGGIAGVSSLVRVPLFVVGTTGYAASDFRDLPGTGTTLDLADMGEVDPAFLGTFPFATGVGTGGTFTNPSTLPINEACCQNGANIVWAPSQVGVPLTSFNRVFDRGPGPDGIPGCMNDTSALGNGQDACDQRLGKGPDGPSSDGFNATGQDDVPTQYVVGASGSIPASANRYGLKPATSDVVSYFTTTYGYTSPNPTSVNSIASFVIADIDVFGADNTDILVKVNTSFCPLVGLDAKCPGICLPGQDTDGDLVCNLEDNCPTVSNANQLDGDSDGVGNACDNCIFVSNPRVNMALLTAGAAANTNLVWATTTGEQRDDDHDGYGNKCDGDFTPAAINVGTGDLQQYNASSGKSRLGDTCGTAGTQPCARYDLDEGTGLNIGTPDKTRLNALFGFPAGGVSPAGTGKCPTCPLPCAAGSAGNCF